MTNKKFYALGWLCLVPLFAACSKFGFDANQNCLNKEASCFVKDVTAPTIASSTPAQTVTLQQTSDLQSITFSEPVNGADKVANYLFSGPGGGNLVMSSITKVDEKNYQFTVSGGLLSGGVTLTLVNITDWAGNALSSPSLSWASNVGIGVTITASGLPGGYYYVSGSGGTATQSFTWQSDTVAEQYFVNIVASPAPCPTNPSSSNSTGTGNTGIVSTANSNITTQIKASDMAGAGIYIVCVFVNKTSLPLKSGGAPISFTRDDTAPAISSVSPAAGTSVNNTQVGYTISEDCAPGSSVTWTRTGGTADATPHTQALVTGEMTSGVHSAFTLTNNPTLVIGAIYAVAFNCSDYSGNIATTVTQTNVTYDTTVPVVANVTSSTADGTYGSASTISIQVVFSKTVNVAVGTPQLTIATGAPATTVLNYVSGTGTSTLTFNYTIVAGNSSADLDYANAAALALNGSTIQDTAGNAANLTLVNPGAGGSLGANKNLVIDTTPAFVSNVTSAVANGSYGLGQTIGVRVVFNKIVTVTGTPQLTLTTGSPATTAVNYVSGSGTTTLLFNYTTAVGNSSADLDYASAGALALAGGSISTLDGGAVLTLASPGAAGSLGANKNFVIDTTAPVISAVAPVTNSTVGATVVSYTLSENCASGSITWTQTGGTADVASPHIQALVGTELNSGTHSSITITNNPSLVDGSIYSIAFNCVDLAGNAAISVTQTNITFHTTGSVWTARTMPSSENWSAVTYGNGLFVAVASLSNISYTSPDGMTWTPHATLPMATSWSSITYGNGIFVAIGGGGGSGCAAASTDGATWTSGTLGPSNGWTSVTFGNGLFVAGAYNGISTESETSTDGVTWNSAGNSNLPLAVGNISVAYGNGQFVAVSASIGNTVALSSDGLSWSTQSLPVTTNWTSVTYGNGVYVAITSSNQAATSADGITWVARALTSNASWNSIAYGNGVFVIVAGNPSNKAATSTDGITWVDRTLPSSDNWSSVTNGNGIFVAVANGSTNGATSP